MQLCEDVNNDRSCSNLLASGLKHHQAAKLAEAEACYRRVLDAHPDHPDALHLLGLIAQQRRNLEQAVELINRAINQNSHPVYYSNLGVTLNQQGKLEEAIAAYHKAIRIKPDFAEAYSNLGNSLNEQGKLREAIIAFRRAISIRPDFHEAGSNLLFCLNDDERMTNAELFAAHRAWAQRHAKGLPRTKNYANVRDPERRLRVGYVSPDFRLHSVAYFLEPLLRSHHPDAIEVFCYSDVMHPDALTDALRGLAEHWCVSVGLSDHELADRIRGDLSTSWLILRVIPRTIGCAFLRADQRQSRWLGWGMLIQPG